MFVLLELFGASLMTSSVQEYEIIRHFLHQSLITEVTRRQKKFPEEIRSFESLMSLLLCLLGVPSGNNRRSILRNDWWYVGLNKANCYDGIAGSTHFLHAVRAQPQDAGVQLPRVQLLLINWYTKALALQPWPFWSSTSQFASKHQS